MSPREQNPVAGLIEGVTRRRALSGAMVAGLSLPVLSACGGSDAEGGTDTVAADPTQPASGGVAATADVPVGGGVIVAASKVVVTQPEAGDFKCFTAVCTHTGCLVNSIQDGAIVCPCHGSTFDLATGDVLGGPAAAPLAAVAFTVEDDEIVLG